MGRIVGEVRGDQIVIPHGPDRDTIRKIPDGKLLSLTWRIPRNPKLHRKYFALINVLRENIEAEYTVDQLQKMLQVKIGNCEVITMRDGKRVGVPQSIAFDSIGNDEFQRDVYVPTVQAIAEILHCSYEDVETQTINEM